LIDSTSNQSETGKSTNCFQSLTNKKTNHVSKKEGKKFYCKLCMLNFSCVQSLRRHSKSKSHMSALSGIPAVLIPGHYKCSVCLKTFTRKNHLTEHQNIHLPKSQQKKFECKICNVSYNRRFCLWQHMKSKKHICAVNDDPNMDPFKCDLCLKSYSYKRNLKYHMNSHLPESQQRYKCDICKKKFDTRGCLKSHLASKIHETKVNLLSKLNETL
jgi:hypothetical protein